MGGYMAEDITKKIKDLDKNYDVQVDVTFDPPWEPTMMSDKGKEMLGFNVKKMNKKKKIRTRIILDNNLSNNCLFSV